MTRGERIGENSTVKGILLDVARRICATEALTADRSHAGPSYAWRPPEGLTFTDPVVPVELNYALLTRPITGYEVAPVAPRPGVVVTKAKFDVDDMALLVEANGPNLDDDPYAAWFCQLLDRYPGGLSLITPPEGSSYATTPLVALRSGFTGEQLR